MIWIILKGILLCLSLCYGAYEDMKTREIPDMVPVVILLAGFIGFSPIFPITGLLIAGLPLFLAALWSSGGIGGGDVKLMAACGFALGAWGGTLQIIIGLSFAVIFTFLRAMILHTEVNRRMSIPLGPFLGAGGIIAYLITYIGGSI